ncbi:G-protein coupled receptor Mth-like isoform X2 [Tigriopus californicus]|nr:G-protein coupled receptor Mth-like isoform X2 [Tigriopus californicus]
MPSIYDWDFLNPSGFSKSWLNLFPSTIFNMKTENLFVTGTDDFKLRADGTLRFHGKLYSPKQYCLDNSINYCERGVVATLRAIVEDEELNRQGAGAIFGTNKEDSETSIYIKRVGYPISIICLLITLVIFVVVPELRKDLYGKMVISIVTSQTIVFICLLVGTFPSVSVSRINGPCITQAILTYFFILCGFMWIGAEADYQRFLTYSAFCFGAPLLMATLVLALDRNIFNLDSDASNWRPGFGEESCWFTSCSNALTYFLYIPITGMLLTNVSFFTYAAVKLGGMQRRIREARPESKRGSDHENPNRRKFVRQVSILSNKSAGSKNKVTLKANRDSLITYLKLFVAMGLTWVFEILAWVLSEKSVQAPQPIIICLNMVNICQGIVMFVVFALKDTTRQKILDAFSSRGHQSTGFRSGARSYQVNRVSRNNRSSSSITRQTSCSFDKSSDDEMGLPLQVISNPNPGGSSFQDQDLTMVDMND